MREKIILGPINRIKSDLYKEKIKDKIKQIFHRKMSENRVIYVVNYS